MSNLEKNEYKWNKDHLKNTIFILKSGINSDDKKFKNDSLIYLYMLYEMINENHILNKKERNEIKGILIKNKDSFIEKDIELKYIEKLKLIKRLNKYSNIIIKNINKDNNKIIKEKNSLREDFDIIKNMFNNISNDELNKFNSYLNNQNVELGKFNNSYSGNIPFLKENYSLINISKNQENIKSILFCYTNFDLDKKNFSSIFDKLLIEYYTICCAEELMNNSSTFNKGKNMLNMSFNELNNNLEIFKYLNKYINNIVYKNNRLHLPSMSSLVDFNISYYFENYGLSLKDIYQIYNLIYSKLLAFELYYGNENNSLYIVKSIYDLINKCNDLEIINSMEKDFNNITLCKNYNYIKQYINTK